MGERLSLPWTAERRRPSSIEVSLARVMRPYLLAGEVIGYAQTMSE